MILELPDTASWVLVGKVARNLTLDVLSDLNVGIDRHTAADGDAGDGAMLGKLGKEKSAARMMTAAKTPPAWARILALDASGSPRSRCATLPAVSFRASRLLESLVWLPNLRALNLSRCQLTDAHFEAVARCVGVAAAVPGLSTPEKRLSLLPCGVPLLPNLQVLCLQENRIESITAVVGFLQCIGDAKGGRAALRYTSLRGNAALMPYRRILVHDFPDLVAIDEHIVTDTERLEHQQGLLGASSTTKRCLAAGLCSARARFKAFSRDSRIDEDLLERRWGHSQFVPILLRMYTRRVSAAACVTRCFQRKAVLRQVAELRSLRRVVPPDVPVLAVATASAPLDSCDALPPSAFVGDLEAAQETSRQPESPPDMLDIHNVGPVSCESAALGKAVSPTPADMTVSPPSSTAIENETVDEFVEGAHRPTPLKELEPLVSQSCSEDVVVTEERRVDCETARFRQRRERVMQRLSNCIAALLSRNAQHYKSPKQEVVVPGGVVGCDALRSRACSLSIWDTVVIPTPFAEVFLSSMVTNVERACGAVLSVEPLRLSHLLVNRRTQNNDGILDADAAVRCYRGLFLGTRRTTRLPTTLQVVDTQVGFLPAHVSPRRPAHVECANVVTCFDVPPVPCTLVRFSQRCFVERCLRRDRVQNSRDARVATQDAYCPVFSLEEVIVLAAVHSVQCWWRRWSTQRRHVTNGTAVTAAARRAGNISTMMEKLKRANDVATKLAAPMHVAQKIADWCCRNWRRVLAVRRTAFLRHLRRLTARHALDQRGTGGTLHITANALLQLLDMQERNALNGGSPLTGGHRHEWLVEERRALAARVMLCLVGDDARQQLSDPARCTAALGDAQSSDMSSLHAMADVSSAFEETPLDGVVPPPQWCPWTTMYLAHSSVEATVLPRRVEDAFADAHKDRWSVPLLAEQPPDVGVRCTQPSLLDIALRGGVVRSFVHAAPDALFHAVDLSALQSTAPQIPADSHRLGRPVGVAAAAAWGSSPPRQPAAGPQAYKRRARRRTTMDATGSLRSGRQWSHADVAQHIIRLCRLHPDGYVTVKFATAEEAFVRQLVLSSMAYDEKDGTCVCFDELDRVRRIIAVARISRWWSRRRAHLDDIRRKRRRQTVHDSIAVPPAERRDEAAKRAPQRPATAGRGQRPTSARVLSSQQSSSCVPCRIALCSSDSPLVHGKEREGEVVTTLRSSSAVKPKTSTRVFPKAATSRKSSDAVDAKAPPLSLRHVAAVNDALETSERRQRNALDRMGLWLADTEGSGTDTLSRCVESQRSVVVATDTVQVLQRAAYQRLCEGTQLGTTPRFFAPPVPPPRRMRPWSARRSLPGGLPSQPEWPPNQRDLDVAARLSAVVERPAPAAMICDGHETNVASAHAAVVDIRSATHRAALSLRAMRDHEADETLQKKKAAHAACEEDRLRAVRERKRREATIKSRQVEMRLGATLQDTATTSAPSRRDSE